MVLLGENSWGYIDIVAACGAWCVVRALRGRKKRGGFKFKLAVNGLWHT